MSVSTVAVKAWRCFVATVLLCPVFWPVLIGQWLARLFFLKQDTKLAEKAKEERGGKTLPTAGALGICILLACMILKIGDFVNWILVGWWKEIATAVAEQSVEYENTHGSKSSPDLTFHTPPSSPPPFETRTNSDSPDLPSGTPPKGSVAAAPTLRERLRQLGATISVIRRFGGYGLVTYRPPQSTLSTKAKDQPDFRLGIGRSMRAYNLFEEIKREYEQAEETINHGIIPRETVMPALHERSAKKVLELARSNGGLYNKAAQFVASLQGGAGDKGIPKEYVDVLRVLTDSAPFRPLSEMNEVLMEEFEGRGASALFASFDEIPIAAASLAQVHRATMHDGREVAVKIMYPSLKREMASDFAMFRRLGSQIQPGGYDLGWMVSDFEEAIKCELDLVSEARNAQETARLFAGRRGVIIPKVIWELTRESVLTMEYVPGLLRVSEPGVVQANGLSLIDCGQLICDTLAEMALCWGHVHGDPHAGNIYVCAERNGMIGKKPCVVLLDHGLYHEIDDIMRRDMCLLFNACIARSRPEICRLAERIAGPMHRFYPLLLSPWFVLGTGISWEDLDAARHNQLPPSITSADVGTALQSLHDNGGNVLGLLHSFGYTRGLLNSLDFSERRRLKSLSVYSTLGIMPREMMSRALSEGLHTLPMHWRIRIWMGLLQVDVTAVMLRVLTIMLAPELDASHSLHICVLFAELVLEIGRMPVVQFLARVLGLSGAVGVAQQADASSKPDESPRAPRETALREEEQRRQAGGGAQKDLVDDDGGQGAEEEQDAAAGIAIPAKQGAGRWEAGMMRVRHVVETATSADEEDLPVRHVGTPQRRGLIAWGGGIVRAVLRARGASSRSGEQGAEDRGGGQAARATRRVRHHSPSSRAASAQRRPWV